jgi:hypothetical protein
MPTSQLTIAMSAEDLAVYERGRLALQDAFREAADGQPQLSVFDAAMDTAAAAAVQLATEQPAVGPALVAAVRLFSQKLEALGLAPGERPM